MRNPQTIEEMKQIYREFGISIREIAYRHGDETLRQMNKLVEEIAKLRRKLKTNRPR